MSSTLQRNSVSPNAAYAVLDETEADGSSGTATVTTIFLTASECPVGCTMCDLWQNTLANPTPAGAIPRQIREAMEDRQPADWIKLYNSGNFFDANSIPPADYLAIAKLCSDRTRVIVENHPRFGRDRTLAFRDLISGQLEIAVGLETVQPRWLDRLGKKLSRDRFDAYARWLHEQKIDLRVFLIVGVPHASIAESIKWSRLSVRHAVAAGARHVSLIPSRTGHGWGGEAEHLPEILPADLDDLQIAAIDDANAKCVVSVDLWGFGDDHEQADVVQRLSQRNLDQTV